MTKVQNKCHITSLIEGLYKANNAEVKSNIILFGEALEEWLSGVTGYESFENGLVLYRPKKGKYEMAFWLYDLTEIVSLENLPCFMDYYSRSILDINQVKDYFMLCGMESFDIYREMFYVTKFSSTASSSINSYRDFNELKELWIEESLIEDTEIQYYEYEELLKNYKVYGLYDGDQIIGGFSLREVVSGFLLEHVVISREYQGKGYSMKLLSLLDGLGDKKQIRLFVNENNRKAISAYEKFGFFNKNRLLLNMKMRGNKDEESNY